MPKPPTLPTSNRGQGDAALRAMATSFVVFIHIMSNWHPSPFFNGSPHQWWAVSLDQLSRVCVPLFVLLSGYGLTRKYLGKPFSWVEFASRRLGRLIPWYVVWSAIFSLAFWLVPIWRSWTPGIPLWKQLLYGTADYHLYFIPMIFQLYLAFPLLLKIIPRRPWFWLAVIGVGEVIWFWFMGRDLTTYDSRIYFVSDQHQYIWGITWLWYFALGMVVAQHRTKFKAWAGPGLVTLGFAALGFGVWYSFHQLAGGLDPLFALRFTRWPVLLFASLLSVGLLLLSETWKNVPKWVVGIGNWSYQIYLGHTLALRVLFWGLVMLGIQ